ncbi:MAG: hypothetical protein R2764_13505 [Bacteroidales bacterium]
MKAFKQINFSYEYRMVFSYAAVLCMASFFIVLSPVLAQDDVNQNKPEVKIDIKKEFDDMGNIIFFDSVYSWSWNGHDFPVGKLDSLFESLNHGLENFDFSNRFHFHDFPLDSVNISYFNFEDFQKRFDENFNVDDFFLDKELLKKFQFDNREFMERFRQYSEEHQKLIEKYFRQPNNEEEGKPKAEPNNYSPGNNKPAGNHSGQV